MTSPIAVGGPFFDELFHGQVFDDAPAVTITSGMAATHQAIVGDRLRLPLDASLSAAVTGDPASLAHPGLVVDMAVGQSTVVTHHVKANLFYRGLRFLRYPHVGDTLSTVTEVVGLKENARRPGRAATGLAALRMTTTDQHGNPVLDFYRCAMLPLSPDSTPRQTAHSDDLSIIGHPSPDDLKVPDWDLALFRKLVPGQHFSSDLTGRVYSSSADVVSNAPELARLTLNIAATHHDERASTTGRLVYGGHVIGLALAQASRALPNLITVTAWDSCDHTGPVHEGNTVSSELTVEGAEPLPDGGGMLTLHSVVTVDDTAGGPSKPVLDWRFRALMA